MAIQVDYTKAQAWHAWVFFFVGVISRGGTIARMTHFMNNMRGATDESLSQILTRDRATQNPEVTRAAQQLEERVDKLVIICTAMWSLIQDKTKLTEKDLIDRVEAIDAADNVVDGKVTRGVLRCHACNRAMSPRHSRCIFCGADRPVSSAFDRVV